MHQTNRKKSRYLKAYLDNQPLSPPPPRVQHQITDLPSIEILTTEENSKARAPAQKTFCCTRRRFACTELPWKLILLVLFTQLTESRASEANPSAERSLSVENQTSRNEFAIISELEDDVAGFPFNISGGEPGENLEIELEDWESINENDSNVVNENETRPKSQKIVGFRTPIGPFVFPRTCSVTREEILDLLNVLQNVSQEIRTANQSMDKGVRNIHFRISDTSNIHELSHSCAELTYETKNRLNYIVEEFKSLKSLAVDTTIYKGLTRSFEVEIKILNTNIENLIRIHSQEILINVKEFEAQIQELKTLIDEFKSENQILPAEENEKTMKLCLSEIDSGKYESAARQFHEQNDDNLLVNIVKGAYDNNLDKFDNVLEFARKLPRFSQAAIAYEKLFEEMKRNQHLSSPKVLILLANVNEYMSRPIYFKLSENNKTKSKFVSLKKQLENSTSSITTAWAKSVRHGKFGQVNSFAKESTRAANSLNHYLFDIIQKVYANFSGNFQKTLEFIDQLPWRSHICTGYEALFDAMQRSDNFVSSQLIKFAYALKKSGDVNHPNLKERFQNLKNNLPVAIKQLIWGEACTIRNIYFDEYLYSEGHAFQFPDGSRPIFTWVPGSPVSGQTWKFEPVDNANSFYMKNQDRGGYLSAIPYDGEYMFVISNHRPDSKDQWYLEPENQGQNTDFRMKTVRTNLYLSATSSLLESNGFLFEDRRLVFTADSNTSMFRLGGRWKLNCSYNGC